MQGRLLKSEIHPQGREQFQFYGSNVISVFSSLLVQNCLWRIKNYSSRYLLYESLLFSDRASCVSNTDLLILGSIRARRRHFSAKVTRREGTSQSNSLCARGNFASKMDWTQMGTCNRKIGIARDPPDRLEFPSSCPAQFFMENNPR